MELDLKCIDFIVIFAIVEHLDKFHAWCYSDKHANFTSCFIANLWYDQMTIDYQDLHLKASQVSISNFMAAYFNCYFFIRADEKIKWEHSSEIG